MKSPKGLPIIVAVLIACTGIVTLIMTAMSIGCGEGKYKTGGEQPISETGVTRASADISTLPSGLTVEQENIINRLEMDNEAGAIKYLYVTSAYTGQLIMYSTVQGKVTSSGKRLTPYTVAATDGEYVDRDLRGVSVNIGGRAHRTSEVLQDDGTYGSSVPYLYWWDSNGTYRQIYPSGGIMIQISDQPLSIPDTAMQMVILDE